MSINLMPKPITSNIYFTQDTEDAIIKYNLEQDSRVKNKVFTDSIYPAFYKLTENIIHKFKFYYTDVEDISDLQHEIIVFLLGKMHLFDPSKGAKAYSYFGTIVKRWLIAYNDRNYKKLKKEVEVDQITDDLSLEFETDATLFYEIDEEKPYEVREKLEIFVNSFTAYFSENLFVLFPDEYDRSIADSILELFRKRENIDIFNKKALYLYIREVAPAAKTVHISRVAKILKEIFLVSYNGYTVTGNLTFEIYINQAYERLFRERDIR